MRVCLILPGILIAVVSPVLCWRNDGIPTENAPGKPVKATATRLLNHLFQHYSTYIRPRSNQNESVLVEYFIALRQIINIDVKTQRMTLCLYQRQTWVDEFLQWNPDDFDGLSELYLNPNDLWIPDVIFQNSLSGMLDLAAVPVIKALLWSNGRVNFFKPTIQSTTCKMSVRHFPYDTQLCSFRIGSWMLNQKFVDIQVFDFDKSEASGEFIEHHEWALYQKTVVRRAVTVDMPASDVGNHLVYPYLDFMFLFERKPEFFEKNVIMPTTLICALSTVAFLLPNESGEKLTFSVTVFLALCVNLLVVTNQVPASSESFPIIGHYYITCIVLVTISIFQTTIILSFHFKGEHLEVENIPPRLKNFVFNIMAPALGFETSKTLQIIKKACCPRVRKKEKQKKRYKFSTFETSRIRENFKLSARQTDNLLLSQTKLNYKSCNILPENFHVTDILESIVKIENHMRESAEEEITKIHKSIAIEEWKLLSRVLDRFSAITYGLLTVGFTVYFVASVRDTPNVDLPMPDFNYSHT